MNAKKKEPINGLAAWARHVVPNMVRDRLLVASPAIVRASYFASVGVPVMVSDANRQRVALATVAAGLAGVRASRNPARALFGLVRELAHLVDDDGTDDDAFARFDVQAIDVTYAIATRHNATRVTAWLLRRAGACGVHRKARPTRQEIAATMAAMKQKARRVRRAT